EAGAPGRVATKAWIALHARRKSRLEPAAALAPVASRQPEEPDRAAEPERDVGASVLERVAERGTDVVVLRFEPAEPNRGTGAAVQLGLRQLPELEEVGAVPMPETRGAAGFLESLERELADRLQHPETAVRGADEALVDQRLEDVEVGLANRFGCFERAAAAEDGEPGEQPLLVLGKQVVAPFDRGPQ